MTLWFVFSFGPSDRPFLAEMLCGHASHLMAFWLITDILGGDTNVA